MADPKRKRRYKPRDERRPSPKKAEVAAARPRDERGHFLPQPGSRRARIIAASGRVPAALAGVVGDSDELLADLAVEPGRVPRQ